MFKLGPIYNMYLALKWLIFLALLMWILLCSLDMQARKREISWKTACSNVPVYKNKSQSLERIAAVKVLGKRSVKLQDRAKKSLSYIHYLTFIAGAIVVVIFERKREIIIFVKTNSIHIKKYFCKIKSKIQFKDKAKNALDKFNEMAWNLMLKAIYLNVDIIKKFIMIWQNRTVLLDMQNVSKPNQRPNEDKPEKRNDVLLKRLRDVVQERNKLRQVLIAVMRENKTLKQQWQIERLAKTRSLNESQNAQKQIKENRTKLMELQQHYMIAHQENIFLKKCIQKLTREKSELDKTLMLLVSKIFKSSDGRLKDYCTFIIKKSKVKACKSSVSISENRCTENIDILGVTLIEDGGLFKFAVKDPTMMKGGLPGQGVWTVKDKDGLIEKLYEYDYGVNFDNGDAIRRIREYTVYHDKDCLLDFTNSSATTIFSDQTARSPSSSIPRSSSGFPSNRRFLTDSPIFKAFLQNNSHLALVSPSSP